MLTPRATESRLLQQTASVTVTDLYGLGRDALDKGDVAEWPLAEIIETLDQRTCPLCRRVHGMVLSRNDPRYHQYKHPSHINCRRIMVFIGAGELGDDGKPLKPDFVDPDKELVKKHGHFHIDQSKYAALRIPSRPEGRDFIVSRGKLLWRPGLTDRARRATINDILSEVLSDEATLALSGPLIRSLILGSAESADFADLPAALAHKADWPELQSDFDFVALAYRLAVQEGAQVALYDLPSGAVRIALYAEGVKLAEDVIAKDVLLTYDPLAAQIETLRKRSRAWLSDQPNYKPL